jgi:nucleoside-diphosphate-sugar epimerase
LAIGHEVSGVDSGFHAHALLYQPNKSQPAINYKDVRHLDAQALSGFDAVVHLAGLCNDPLGEFLPSITRDINLGGTLNTAIAAREAGVSRFINFSSCSVYGANGSDAPVSESCVPNPLTEYARCKLLSEVAINHLASDSFTVVSMRNATVFGPSPRMRFDLVLNNLAGRAWISNEIKLRSDGTPWRPLIHIADLARATALLLDAPKSLVNRQVFNIGDDRLNHQVRDLAEEIARAVSGSRVKINGCNPDSRSYKVSFAKIRSTLDFTCEHDVSTGTRELLRLFERIELRRETFESPMFDRLKWIQTLIASGRLDRDLYWVTSAPPAELDQTARICA